MCKLRIIILLLLVTFLGACSTVQFLKTDESNSNLPPTNPENIKFYSTSETGKAYIALGEVIVAYETGEDSYPVVVKMAEEAARVGGDAVINLRFGFVRGFWTTGVKGIGTIVKFK